jgi:hypothetical protein
MPTAPFDAANKLYVDSTSGGSNGWTDDGPVVRLSNPIDLVRVGGTDGSFGKLYVEAPAMNAIVATCMYYGVSGYARERVGLYGVANERYGVIGKANYIGVYGLSKNVGVYGFAHNTYGVEGEAENFGVYGHADYTKGVFGFAINYGVYGHARNYGVYGLANNNYAVYGYADKNYGVYGYAKNYGVYGHTKGNYGVYGYAENYGLYGCADDNYGVYGISSNRYGVGGYAINGRGVYGYSEENYGAYFGSGSGNALYCNGNIRMASGHNIYRGGAFKAFEIDHPLDPGNKILRHFCVEGPEALVLYSGTAVLDKSGEAVVKLPDYFDALSRNPRVQVTPVGSAAAIGIKQRMTGNTFIVIGPPGTEFDWLVLAERDDRQARLERIYRPVEQGKTGMKQAVY